jgi:hypothetical protein
MVCFQHPIWVNFDGPLKGYIFWPVGIYYFLLVHLVAICMVYFPPFRYIHCVKKNLATRHEKKKTNAKGELDQTKWKVMPFRAELRCYVGMYICMYICA